MVPIPLLAAGQPEGDASETSRNGATPLSQSLIDFFRDFRYETLKSRNLGR